MLSQILTIGLTADLVSRGQGGIVTENLYALAITILVLWFILLALYTVSSRELVPWFILITGFNVIVCAVAISKKDQVIGKDLNNIAVVALIINVVGLVIMLPTYKELSCKLYKRLRKR